jgi:hypothetical protein
MGEIKGITDELGIEAFNTVVFINDNINEQWADNPIMSTLMVGDETRLEENLHFYQLEFMSNGEDYVIEFLGIQIWNSEDDLREYDDKNDCYIESLESYIRNQMFGILRNLEVIKQFLISNKDDMSKEIYED